MMRTEIPSARTAEVEAGSRAIFWSKVKKTAGCWLWTAATNDAGYGKVNHRRRIVAAHRSAFAAANGPIPNNLWVLHRCDNPPCVNPDHLFLGTSADNVRDMFAKGRGSCKGAVGERNPHALLTAATVIEARRRFRNGETAIDLAREMGVSGSAMTAVVRGQSWRHVGGPTADSAIRPRSAESRARNSHPGELNSQAKLTAVDVVSIRRLAASGVTHQHIADRFGVRRTNVGLIVSRKTWAHVIDTGTPS